MWYVYVCIYIYICVCVCVCVCVYVYNGILFSLKKEENFNTVATWMKLENIMLSEVSQTQKNKYYMISLM